MDKEEVFARKCAADGWSQSNVAEALGLSKYKLRLWLETIPAIQWPKPWESKNAKAAVQRLNASREGIYPEHFRRTAEKSLETRRKNLLLRSASNSLGKPGSIAEYARRHGVSPEAVRYRTAQGFRLDYALACAKRAKEKNNRIYTAFGVKGSLSALVKQFGVVTKEAVSERMRKGMPPETALTLPAQHLVAAYSRKDGHIWKCLDDASFNQFASRNPSRVGRSQN
jgi:hypothetical protein